MLKPNLPVLFLLFMGIAAIVFTTCEGPNDSKAPGEEVSSTTRSEGVEGYYQLSLPDRFSPIRLDPAHHSVEGESRYTRFYGAPNGDTLLYKLSYYINPRFGVEGFERNCPGIVDSTEISGHRAYVVDYGTECAERLNVDGRPVSFRYLVHVNWLGVRMGADLNSLRVDDPLEKKSLQIRINCREEASCERLLREATSIEITKKFERY